MTIGDGASPPMLSDGRNSGSASSDGLGGTEPNFGPGPRYIYYRLYAQLDGPIKSNNPIYSNNAFISRVMPRSVPPPRTASSLKRHLCKIEGFSAPESCTLYLSLSENVPVDGGTRLSLQGNLGPGLSSSDPVALVVSPHEIGKRSPASVETRALGQVPEQLQLETRYVHYRVYDESGEVTSKTSFDKDDTSLGRTDVLSVSPPHTVASLKDCIAKAEGMADHDLQTFEDDMGENILKDDDTITILADVYPGIVQDAPIAVVFHSKKARTTSDRTFTKRLQIIYPFGAWACPDPKWHSVKDKEIFKTDGILRSELYDLNKNTNATWQ